MQKLEEYRGHAKECREMAAKTAYILDRMKMLADEESEVDLNR